MAKDDLYVVEYASGHWFMVYMARQGGRTTYDIREATVFHGEHDALKHCPIGGNIRRVQAKLVAVKVID